MQARERVVSGRVYKAAGQVVPRVLRLVAAVEYVSLCVCVCRLYATWNNLGVQDNYSCL